MKTLRQYMIDSRDLERIIEARKISRQAALNVLSMVMHERAERGVKP